MASIRRHLASLGLAVVLCHVVMQILIPAALCCQAPLAGTGGAQASDCCPAGSHPGQICPMHGNRAGRQKSSDSECAAQPRVDLHDIFTMLASGGVVPTPVELAVPVGSESAPATAEPAASILSPVPLGPPPRA